jgi:hypothetical protein
MATFLYSTTTQAGVDPNAVFQLNVVNNPEYPAPPFLPGELMWGTDGSEFVYATSSITIAAGSVVIFSPTPGSWSVALLNNTNGRTDFGQLVGVVGGATGSVNIPAPGTNVTGNYFWVQRAGNAQKVLSGYTLGTTFALTHTSTVGGQIGATGGAGTSAQIAGIVFSQVPTATGAGYNAVLNYPTVGTAD